MKKFLFTAASALLMVTGTAHQATQAQQFVITGGGSA
jgi:hypothetical protein